MNLAVAEKAPEGTRPGTAWIWVFVLLPLLQLAEVPLQAAVYQRIFAGGLSDPSAMTRAELSPSSGYLPLTGLTFVLYGIYVVIAALDYRALRARGVPRPFHWAWTFLGSLVYIIGRTVVVRRRTGSGLAPLWVFIGLVVISAIASVAILAPIMNAALSAAVSSAG